MIECMRGRYHHIMSRVAGVVTCGAIAALAHGTSETMSIARGDGRPSPVPAAPLAVAIGAIARAVAFADATTFERTLRRGVTFCGGSGLKMGVAALGAKLSLTEIGDDHYSESGRSAPGSRRRRRSTRRRRDDWGTRAVG